MITDPHAVGLHLVGQFIELLRLVEPVLFRLARHGRDDEEGVADGAVELDGLRKLVRGNGFVRRVRAARHQPEIIEHLAQLLRAAAVVTGEFDALVAGLGNRRERAGQIFRTLLAHGIKLYAYGNLASGGSFGQTREADAHGQAGSAKRGAAEKIATGNPGYEHIFHG